MPTYSTGKRDAFSILVDQGMTEAQARAELARQEAHARAMAEANERNARLKGAAAEREAQAVERTLTRWGKAAAGGDLVAHGREALAALEAELTIARRALALAERRSRQAAQALRAAQGPQAAA